MTISTIAGDWTKWRTMLSLVPAVRCENSLNRLIRAFRLQGPRMWAEKHVSTCDAQVYGFWQENSSELRTNQLYNSPHRVCVGIFWTSVS